MLNYRFSIRDKDGTNRENAGWMTLVEDDEAIVFGKAVVRDLLRGNAMRYARWIMEITEGERAVGSIPFEVARSFKSQKNLA